MHLKMKLLVIPSLLAASVLGACAPQEDASLTTPDTTDVEVVEGVETPAVIEDQAQGTEPDTGVVGESEAGVTEPTTAAPAEEQAGAEATTAAPAEEQAGAEATTAAPAEEQAGAEATTVAPAEEQAGVTDQQTTPDMGQFEMLSAVKASEIIGYGVENAQGEDLGEIEDLLVDFGNSQARYAVLSFGGFLDIGDKLFAIPLDAIQFNPDEQVFMFDVTEEELETAPSFARDDWPDTSVTDWDMAFRDFWRDSTESMGESEDQAVTEGEEPLQNPEALESGRVLRASEVLDYTLSDAQMEAVGEVEDLIVQMDQPHLAYAVLTLENVEDPAQAERFYAVPLNNLQFEGEEGVFVFNIDQQALDTALSFSPDEWSEQMNLEEDVN
jgi:sporulation protein YlmC with PRC-barrel domain